MLEHAQSSKKAQTISQWVAPLNTFIAIEIERAPQYAPKLMRNVK